MNEFDYDVYLKKRIARGYHNKKNGSKSKRCSLTSDGMTQKQWKERNGAIMSYDLSAPMSWNEFKAMPLDLQREYIGSLRSKYNTTATDLAGFFECVPSTITKYCKSALGITFEPGKRMTREQKEAFREFTGSMEDVPEFCTDENCIARDVFEPISEPMAAPESRASDFNMREISMSFMGNFDADMIRNSLALTIGKGRPVQIEIKCTIIN